MMRHIMTTLSTPHRAASVLTALSSVSIDHLLRRIIDLV